MSNAPLLSCGLLYLALGCAGASPPRAEAPTESAKKRPPALETATLEEGPQRTFDPADMQQFDGRRTEGPDERFATDRQVAVLRQAITLYRQFLVRAGDEPEYAEAARRSRERIEDAEQTIAFLLAAQ